MLLNIVSHPIRSMMCPEIGLTKIWGKEIFKLDLVQHKFLSEKYTQLNFHYQLGLMSKSDNHQYISFEIMF